MTKRKILIFGRGFIGERLAEAMGAAVSGRRISRFSDADEEMKRHRPKIIINAIGHTGGANVDGCELDKDRTLSANSFVPIILAEAALRRGIAFVHISSGCIYHYDYAKDKPLTDERIPDFFGLFYSRSKIYAERALEVLSKTYPVLIARIRIPLDDRPHPRNILTKLLAYRRVIDLPNSVTYLPDFINALKHLLKIGARGIYNVVNKGGLRYPDLLDVYRRHVADFRYSVIDAEKLGLVRTNLLLSTGKLDASGFRVRHIKDCLEECVRAYLKKS